MPEQNSLIYLGQIIGVHGVRGWVKIHSECRPRESIFNYPRFTAKRLNQPSYELKLSTGRIQGKGLAAKFSGIDDRDSAYALNGIKLYITHRELPKLTNNEFYWMELIGLDVVNLSNELLGKAIDIFETGANDVLVVRDRDNNEVLIPYVIPDYIVNVDLTKAVITVDWSLEWSQP